jgi:hypothetical protein
MQRRTVSLFSVSGILQMAFVCDTRGAFRHSVSRALSLCWGCLPCAKFPSDRLCTFKIVHYGALPYKLGL